MSCEHAGVHVLHMGALCRGKPASRAATLLANALAAGASDKKRREDVHCALAASAHCTRQ